jgi:hypothetical protein
MSNQNQQVPLTQIEWAYQRTNQIWEEVVNKPDIPYEIWVGIFSNIMGRLLQASAQDDADGLEVANDMLASVATIIEFAYQERFGVSLENQTWRQ